MENKVMVQTADGKVYFVDFQRKKGLTLQKEAVLLNEESKELGIILMVGKKASPAEMFQEREIAESEIEHSQGKKIFYRLRPRRKTDEMISMGTEGIARVYKRVA